jgi:hypothetical protein
LGRGAIKVAACRQRAMTGDAAPFTGRDSYLTEIEIDERMIFLQDDPRYKALLRRTNLPE